MLAMNQRAKHFRPKKRTYGFQADQRMATRPARNMRLQLRSENIDCR
jgi:hypothetical protein